MNTSQLQCMIICDPVLNGYVMGVFPADRLPKRLPAYPYGLVVNTDVHLNNGRHWCSFYSDGNGHMEFFDSYGKQPSINSVHFKRWISDHAKTIKTNDIQLQSSESDYMRFCFFTKEFWDIAWKILSVCLIRLICSQMTALYIV